MNIELVSILAAVEAATPDGRWEMLQRWLKDYPEIKTLAHQSPDQAYLALRDLAARKIEREYKLPGASILNVFITRPIEARIKSAICVLQTCYRERAGNQPNPKKEIKNVSDKRPRAKRINRAKGDG